MTENKREKNSIKESRMVHTPYANIYAMDQITVSQIMNPLVEKQSRLHIHTTHLTNQTKPLTSYNVVLPSKQSNINSFFFPYNSCDMSKYPIMMSNDPSKEKRYHQTHINVNKNFA
ncbi:hypothetical protein ACOSQ2_002877 [Xanthoceras sorbifolium]